jgi:glycosyltransferase involved in cell wall biosynthesis
MATMRSIAWCVDSPGFGGAELDLLSVLRMVDCFPSSVVHGKILAPEFAAGLATLGVRTSVFPGNRAHQAVRGLRAAVRILRAMPETLFVVWAHHSDSNRWLQLALALSGRPFVIAERVVPTSRADFTHSRLSVPIKRLVSGHASAVVLNASSQEATYRQVFGASKARVRIIPGSRDVGAICGRVEELVAYRDALRDRLGLSGFVVTSVGRLVEQKDPLSLVRAVARIAAEGRDVRLVLVGEGPMRGAIEREVASLHAPVLLAGYQPDPIPWLAAADVFALASRYEGLPGAVIEAMAAGLPCVVTDISGNRDLVAADRGRLVPVDSEEALSAALKEIMDLPDRGRALGEAARRRAAQEFDAPAEAARWNSLFRDLGMDSRGEAGAMSRSR